MLENNKKVLRSVNTEYAKRLLYSGTEIYHSSDRNLECHYYSKNKVEKVESKDDFTRFPGNQYYILEDSK